MWEVLSSLFGVVVTCIIYLFFGTTVSLVGYGVTRPFMLVVVQQLMLLPSFDRFNSDGLKMFHHPIIQPTESRRVFTFRSVP